MPIRFLRCAGTFSFAAASWVGLGRSHRASWWLRKVVFSATLSKPSTGDLLRLRGGLFYHYGVLVGEGFPAFAVGVVGIGDHHKGIGVEVADGGGDGLHLAQWHYHEECAVGFEGVESLAVEDGGRAVDVVEDELAQLLVAFFGNDKDNLIVLGARDHIRQRFGHKEDAKQRIERKNTGRAALGAMARAHAKPNDQQSHQHDNAVGADEGVGEPDAQVFLQYHGYDVGAAGGSPAANDESGAGTHQHRPDDGSHDKVV